jgi:hypothetical protein
LMVPFYIVPFSMNKVCDYLYLNKVWCGEVIQLSLQNSQFGIICWGTLDHMDMMWNILQKKNLEIVLSMCMSTSSPQVFISGCVDFMNLFPYSWIVDTLSWN